MWSLRRIARVVSYLLIVSLTYELIRSRNGDPLSILYRGEPLDAQLSSSRGAIGFLLASGSGGLSRRGFYLQERFFRRVTDLTPRTLGFHTLGFSFCVLTSDMTGSDAITFPYVFVSVPHWFLISLMGLWLWCPLHRRRRASNVGAGFEVGPAHVSSQERVSPESTPFRAWQQAR